MKINLYMLACFSSGFILAQETKTTEKAPDMRPLDKSDAVEYENYGLKIELITAQREKLRIEICERYGLRSTCLVGQKADGQWVAVMPQEQKPQLPSKPVETKQPDKK